MGSAWSELTESAKEEYTKQAKELKTAYDKEYRSFLEGLSDDSIKAIEAATGKKLRIPGGKKARKAELNRASGSPGKPLTAFFEFMKEVRETEDVGDLQGREKIIELSKRAGEKWKNMSDSDKQVSRYRARCHDRPGRLSGGSPHGSANPLPRGHCVIKSDLMLTSDSTGVISPLATRPSTMNGSSRSNNRCGVYRSRDCSNGHLSGGRGDAAVSAHSGPPFSETRV